MPLTGIGRRPDTVLSAFTFRELLAQRRLAERAIRRGRAPESARALLARIDAELAERRERLFARRGALPPGLPEEERP